MAVNTPPKINFWHVWTDPDGISHQTLQAVDEFQLGLISKGNSPQWLSSRSEGQMTVLLSVLPQGWRANWHETPAPQWIIPLQGAWGVETMDGKKVEMKTGDLSFGNDLNTKRSQGKQGHRSWTVGDEPCQLLIIQLGEEIAKPPLPYRKISTNSNQREIDRFIV